MSSPVASASLSFLLCRQTVVNMETKRIGRLKQAETDWKVGDQSFLRANCICNYSDYKFRAIINSNGFRQVYALSAEKKFKGTTFKGKGQGRRCLSL